MVREERGVTLVEIIMALAIAAILATTVLFGRDQLRSRQQFSQGVDQIVQMLSAARQEATGTVGRVNFTVGGTSTTEYIYAKLVTLNNSASAIKVETETIDSSDNVKQITNPYTKTIPWGVVPVGAVNTKQFFLFTIQKGGGITTFYTNVSTDVPTTIPSPTSKNYNMVQVVGSKSFDVRDSSGSMTATITVDQSGNVSRVFK